MPSHRIKRPAVPGTWIWPEREIRESFDAHALYSAASTGRGLVIGRLLPDRDGLLYLYPPDNDQPETRGHFPPVLVQEKDLQGKVHGFVQPLPSRELK